MTNLDKYIKDIKNHKRYYYPSTVEDIANLAQAINKDLKFITNKLSNFIE